MKKENPWVIRLITPNLGQAQDCVRTWIKQGYGTQFSKHQKQVMIKKSGPNAALYTVRTRVKS